MTQSSFGLMVVVKGKEPGGSNMLLINVHLIGSYSWLRATSLAKLSHVVPAIKLPIAELVFSHGLPKPAHS
jgi:hypothetical protein